MKRNVAAVRQNRVWLALAGLAVVAVIGFSLVARPAPSLDERAGGLDRQLRCPTCQGLSIADSPATVATQMRAVVREQLRSGARDADVRAFFVARYGRWILLDPPMAGIDLLLWLAPAAIVGAGAGLVVARARAGRRADSRAGSRWSVALPATSRVGGVVVGILIIAALTVPITVALAPRLAGQEATGRAAGRAGPALTELQARVDETPDDPVALLALGEALLADGRGQEAAKWFRATLEIDPTRVRAWLGVGAVLLESGRPDAAFEAFDRVLAIDPDQTDALLFRAVSRLSLVGSVDAAVRADLSDFLRTAAENDARRAMAEALLAPGPSPSPS